MDHGYDVWYDIEHMSDEDLELKYGLEISEDGEVWDSLTYTTYVDLEDWASEYQSSQIDDEINPDDDIATFEKRPRRIRYDD